MKCLVYAVYQIRAGVSLSCRTHVKEEFLDKYFIKMEGNYYISKIEEIKLFDEKEEDRREKYIASIILCLTKYDIIPKKHEWMKTKFYEIIIKKIK
jgi:hypothetical protein